MKEWLIRLGCVFLGVIIAIGAIHLKAILVFPKEEASEEIEAKEVKTSEEIMSDEEQEEPAEIIQDYALEAQLKFQDLLDKKSENEQQETTTEEDNDSLAPNSIEAAPVKWMKDYPKVNSDSTLEEKLAVRSSYDETMAVNAFDKMVIENSTIDFSNVKISIMGDSLTAGSNLNDEEREQYNWPSQLKEILECKEVVNLGIGGSTVCCCVDHSPMCKRWSDIPQDSDIIIVMGGSNDMLFEDKWMFGNIEYDLRMNEGTFCGDLDDMCSRMQWTFIEHNDDHFCKMLYINPPSTILNDGVYAVNPENMVKQEQFAKAINEIVPAYSFEVIDMYNNNILNSHDPDINAQYVYDGIHCNKEGYRILAEHIASQIIQRIEQ